MADYANPDSLVTTDWVAEHLNDPKVRLIEVDVDTTAYDKGHCRRRRLELDRRSSATSPPRHRRPKASSRSCCSQRRRSATTPRSSSTATTTTGSPPSPLASSSATATTTSRLMNGGRKKWLAEGARADRPTLPTVMPTTSYQATDVELELRAFRDEVLQTSSADGRRGAGRRPLARRVHRRDPRASRTCPRRRQRGGHIPGAANIPWAPGRQRRRHVQVAPTSCARSTAARASPRQGRHRLLPHRRALAATPGSCSSTCSASTNVRNYDGSWTEWGSCRRADREVVLARKCTSGRLNGRPAFRYAVLSAGRGYSSRTFLDCSTPYSQDRAISVLTVRNTLLLWRCETKSVSPRPPARLLCRQLLRRVENIWRLGEQS